MEQTPRKISKLESLVLILFGATLIVWIINKFIDIPTALTICIIALFVASLALLVSVLASLVQKKKVAAKAVPKAKAPKKKKR